MFVNFNILNQLGSPAINSNTFANRPAAGQTGRLFVSTDTYEIYRDNGTTWDLIGGPGSSTITGSGTATQVAYFTSSQAIGSSANLYWDNSNTRLGIGTATPTVGLDLVGGSLFTNTQSYSTGVARSNYFDYNLSVAAGGSFTSPNAITALGVTLDLTLAGNATIPSGARSGLDAYNTISFTGTGTLTQSQGTYIRAYSNVTAGWAFAGSATGTVTHLAGLRVLFPDNSGSALSVTNNYGLLINDQTANTGTVTYTNRWGIYQEGASDLNYLNANTLIGTTVNAGYKLDVNGIGRLASGILKNNASTPTYLDFDATNRPSGRNYEIGTGYSVVGNDKFYIYDNTASATRLVIDASGNMGISTSAPASLLSIGGAGYSGRVLSAQANTNAYAVTFQQDNATGSGLQIFTTLSSWGGIPLSIASASAELLRLTSGGNLGINTGTPSTRLHAFGTSGATTILAEGATNNSAYGRLEMRGRPAGLGQSSGWLVVSSTEGGQAATNVGGIDFTMAGASGNAHNMQFATHNGTSYGTRMFLTSTGNFGIGTVTPLEVANYRGISVSGTNGSFLSFYTGSTQNARIETNTGTEVQIKSLTAIPLIFGTNNTEAFRVVSNQNVLIGTTSDSGQKLYLNGSLRIDGQRSGTAGGSSGQHLIINCDGTTYKIALLNN